MAAYASFRGGKQFPLIIGDLIMMTTWEFVKKYP
jgi:hypothetical protein